MKYIISKVIGISFSMKFRNLRRFIIRKNYTPDVYQLYMNNLQYGLEIYREPSMIHIEYRLEDCGVFSIMYYFRYFKTLELTSYDDKMISWTYVDTTDEYRNDDNQLDIYRDETTNCYDKCIHPFTVHYICTLQLDKANRPFQFVIQYCIKKYNKM